MTREILRLCEYSSIRVPPEQWSESRRLEVARAARAWRLSKKLNADPLSWSGADGCTLSARQWVGVVEAAGATVEIYAKLDAGHLSISSSVPSPAQAQSTLSALLWMMSVAGHGEVASWGRAALGESPLSFADVWAFLLGSALLPELKRGPQRAYNACEDDLASPRGRIRWARQAGPLWGRMDSIACAWDEWTGDTPLNRTLKAAARLLATRASSPRARLLLRECIELLSEAEDEEPARLSQVLAVRPLRFGRSEERFREPGEMAQQIVRGLQPSLGSGARESWAFLLDMNKLFESFAARVLEAAFSSRVQTQKTLDYLLRDDSAAGRRLIAQKPDFRWRESSGPFAGRRWIADAKYKRLRRSSEAGSDADPKLEPNDVRQLTVYGEMEARLLKLGPEDARPELAIIYPFEEGSPFEVRRFRAWNGATLHLIPLRLQPRKHACELLPVGVGSQALGTPRAYSDAA